MSRQAAGLPNKCVEMGALLDFAPPSTYEGIGSDMANDVEHTQERGSTVSGTVIVPPADGAERNANLLRQENIPC